MSRLNLFGKEWANIVFEGRNKSYGAYKLRREAGKTTLMSLAIGLGILSAVFGSSYLYASKSPERIILVNNPVVMDNIPVIKSDKDKKTETPVPEEAIKQKQNEGAKQEAAADVQKNIKNTEAKVIRDEVATEDQMASQKDFSDDIQSGKKNLDADSQHGELKSDGGSSGTSKSGGQGSDDGVEGGQGTGTKDMKGNGAMSLVQHKAIPNEGYQRFYENFTHKFSAPNLEGNTKEIVVKLRFVVELDGSFTDIKVLDDKMGVGNEAVRVLKTMPRWKPAEHNGKTVRSVFTLPIKIRMN